MLKLARQAVLADLRHEALPALETYACEAVDHSGAFVTLKNGGRLRGCIGTFRPLGTLPETIGEMAPAAARDPRFVGNPVTADEMGDIRIELSVLSSAERTDDPLSLEVGVHGVLISKGAHRGCFLPQVATEMGWDAETFLTMCCQSKAGLSANAWQDPATEVSLFTAEVFGE